jgi:hypothetical protein
MPSRLQVAPTGGRETTVSQYVFGNAAEQAGQRFHSLEALYDSRRLARR